MVKAYEIALAAHEVCVEDLIPKGISKPHDYPAHLFTGGLYADAINAAGLEICTGGKIVQAIIAIRKWDKKSPWPGHPDPAEVVEYLRNGDRQSNPEEAYSSSGGK